MENKRGGGAASPAAGARSYRALQQARGRSGTGEEPGNETGRVSRHRGRSEVPVVRLAAASARRQPQVGAHRARETRGLPGRVRGAGGVAGGLLAGAAGGLLAGAGARGLAGWVSAGWVSGSQGPGGPRELPRKQKGDSRGTPLARQMFPAQTSLQAQRRLSTLHLSAALRNPARAGALSIRHLLGGGGDGWN